MNSLFSDRLQDYMVNNNISEVKLADIVCVKQPTISRWLNGQSVPNINHVTLLCKEFNIDANWLLGL